MTKKGAKTGTDRVIEIAKKIKSQIYINLQGDEPIFSPKDLRKFINISVKNLNNIIIGHTRIKSKKDYFSKDTVKIVFDKKIMPCIYQERQFHQVKIIYLKMHIVKLVFIHTLEKNY